MKFCDYFENVKVIILMDLFDGFGGFDTLCASKYFHLMTSMIVIEAH